MRGFLSFVTRTFFLLWAVASLVFFTVHILPGDPLSLFISPEAPFLLPEERLVLLKKELKLDIPLPLAYWSFLKDTFTFDFGNSISKNLPVMDLIKKRLPTSLILSLSTCVLSFLLAVPLALFLTLKKNLQKLENKILLITSVLQAFPPFLLGPLLILLFCLQYRWFPLGGEETSWADPLVFVLPTFTLSLSVGTYLFRSVYEHVQDLRTKPFISVAVAKGLSQKRILLFHILPHLMPLICTILVLRIAQTLAGALTLETVFNLPGLGTLLLEGILRRDYPLIQGIVLFIALIFALLNSLLSKINLFFKERGQV